MPQDPKASSDLQKEIFAKWWDTTKAALPADTPEEITWDAAIMAGATLLDETINGLLKEKRYEHAAVTRDCRELVLAAATRPNLWEETKKTKEHIKRIAWYRELLPRLSDLGIQEITAKDKSPELVIALEEFKREQAQRAAKNDGPPI